MEKIAAGVQGGRLEKASSRANSCSNSEYGICSEVEYSHSRDLLWILQSGLRSYFLSEKRIGKQAKSLDVHFFLLAHDLKMQ